MPGENYPNINGHEYSFSDIELRWNGNRYTGFRQLNYKHSREVGKAEGSRPEPYGHTRGIYVGCEGTLIVLRKTYNQMVADMGEGFMEQQFDIDASYGAKFQDPVTDELRGCTLTDEDFNNERGSDAAYVERAFTGLQLLPNGVKPIEGMLE